MSDKFARIFIPVFFAFILFAGILLIYRATLKVPDMTVIKAKVTDKGIDQWMMKGRRYFEFVFTLEGQQDKVGISMTRDEYIQYTPLYNTITPGKTYTFYMDTSFPVNKGVNAGITKIDEDGAELYRMSNATNLWVGILFCAVGVGGALYILKNRKKEEGAVS